MLDHKVKIILDTDIGDDIDDAFALALANQSPEIELLGITTVFRNAKKRAQIARKLVKSLGSDIKVYAGCDYPLLQDVNLLIPPQIKKNERLDEDGKYLPPQFQTGMELEVVEQTHAVDFIIEMVHRYPHEVVLVPIGPLTNIAMAIRKDPELTNLVNKITLMGGYDENKYPEWNIFCDPEAASIVYTSGIPVEMVGLDVTLKCTLTKEDIQELKLAKNQTNQLLGDMMDLWFAHYEFTTPVMHDPLAVASLITDYVTFNEKNVKVDLLEKRGSTLEVEEGTSSSAKVFVATTVQPLPFKKMLKERIFK